VAKKTLQFQMVNVIDFGCNEDHPGSPLLAYDPGRPQFISPLKKPFIAVYWV
jgi:hypothetical protein